MKFNTFFSLAIFLSTFALCKAGDKNKKVTIINLSGVLNQQKTPQAVAQDVANSLAEKGILPTQTTAAQRRTEFNKTWNMIQKHVKESKKDSKE